MKKIRTLTALFGLLSTTVAVADETEVNTSSNFAEYAVLAGVSPLGGFSGSFAHHASEKTSWVFSFGGTPDLNIEVDMDGDTYSVFNVSSWVGFFVNHRPFVNADWFRLVAGLGVGTIENRIERLEPNGFATDEQYEANYHENPVGYLGIGFGMKPVEGFIWAVDIGWLQTSGPEVRGVHAATADGIEAIENSWMFGSVLPSLQLSLGYGF